MGSEHFWVVYNRAPVLPGHSMVIPKAHYKSFLDLGPALRTEMTELSIAAVERLQKVFGAEGFNWTIQDGQPAGQTVMHLHLHLIPRHRGDLPDPGDWYPRLQAHNSNIDSQARPRLSTAELKAIARRLRKA